MSDRGRPKFTVEIEAPANGRVRKATVTVLDAEGKTATTDRADLLDSEERRRLAERLAKKLKTAPDKLQALVEQSWNETLDRRRRVREQAAAGSAEAAAEVGFELLDSSPQTLSRPLCLVAGAAYAAAWVPTQTTTRRTVDAATGEATVHEPPLVHVEDRLLIVTDDGRLYADGPAPGAHPLAELGLTVRLPFAPPPGRAWSGAGVKRYLAGERPDPAETFGRLTVVVDRFLDFARSLADQDVMAELVACYVLGTYFLDAFGVVGYLWPNGERGTGKTVLLQVVSETAYLGHLILAGSSYAWLRDLADYGATLAFDDAEAVMDVRRTDPDKRALLLAGNRRGATVTVKEPEGDRWVTRHVHTFCPRLFSAIRLPDEVLGSRTIIIPLVRSGDPRRAKANVFDPEDWPCDRARLVDDLWALGLAHLRDLPAHDRAAAGLVELAGRNLDPWRPVLAVAHWLQERHGLVGLFDRMRKLSSAYQTERGEYEESDVTRVLIRALLKLTADASEAVAVLPKDVAQEMNAIASAEDLAEPDKDFTNARRVGWLLKRQRFRRPPGHSERGRPWLVTRLEIEALARTYGAEKPSETPAAETF
jgi:hypothetical protein